MISLRIPWARVGLGSSGTFYIAESMNNRIAAIPNALHRNGTAHTGNDVTSNGALDDPLGLTLAPNADIFTINGNNGKIDLGPLSWSQKTWKRRSVVAQR